MNAASKTLAKVKKANKLVQLAFRKNGPKSFKRGQGLLLNALGNNDGVLTRDDLVWIMGCDRGELKGVVKKAARNGYVTFENSEEHGYTVRLTELGCELARKRVAANDRAAEQIAGGLTPEELAQLEALAEKLILSCKSLDICGKKKGRKSNRDAAC